MKTKTQTRGIVYSDWNTMIENTEKDCEFLEALEIYYTYDILIGIDKIEVEFKTY
jgi:hypothetical protein